MLCSAKRRAAVAPAMPDPNTATRSELTFWIIVGVKDIKTVHNRNDVWLLTIESEAQQLVDVTLTAKQKTQTCHLTQVFSMNQDLMRG